MRARLWYHAKNQRRRSPAWRICFWYLVSLLLPLLRLAFRLRLGLPLLFALGMLTMCHSWYQAHTALADGIFLALVGLAALSWAVTFLRWSAETVGYVLADRLAGAALARRVRQARAEGRSMVDTQGL